ncbi:transposase, IS5 family [Nitrosomonas ureae]|uniref:Transposase, IS5 family n=1 Tax=Nitrosomonas ureae TaxID=44577 RepID=A0A1H5YD86_9PROT|nr:transposase, IS5 family [Nitrosomonas ureae]
MYIVQQCFGFSDEGTEDAVYDSQAIRCFVGIDLNREAVPDATTLLKFRHLLEAHHLTESIFDAINAHLAERGLFLREGTIVDATLISAPPSTKNKERARDTEMHQTKKGKQWHFGMKVQHRCRCAIRVCSHPDRNGSQCPRCYSGTGAAAW